MPKKAFVSGCFDLLHSGHVAFFEEAAQFGDLYVAIGSDRNVFELKQRPTINSEAERLYMIKSLSFVKKVFVAKGSGLLDFVEELNDIRPDYFVVNEDGSTPDKKKLCDELGIEYIILKRKPHSGLTPRSTTALRSTSMIPECLDLTAGGLDQPEIALTISIYPLSDGSSSTRSAAIELWGARLPADQPEKLAKVLFGYSNLPGTKEIRGSKTAIGISFPGLAKIDYAGEYWPTCITCVQDEQVLKFIEETLLLVPLDPQPGGSLSPQKTLITAASAQALSLAAEDCWQAILNRDAAAFGRSMKASCQARAAIQPDMLRLLESNASLRDHALGWNICEVAGNCWLLLVSDKPLENTTRISIRRASD